MGQRGGRVIIPNLPGGFGWADVGAGGRTLPRAAARACAERVNAREAGCALRGTALTEDRQLLERLSPAIAANNVLGLAARPGEMAQIGS
jgi:hypothetical protein